MAPRSGFREIPRPKILFLCHPPPCSAWAGLAFLAAIVRAAVKTSLKYDGFVRLSRSTAATIAPISRLSDSRAAASLELGASLKKKQDLDVMVLMDNDI